MARDKTLTELREILGPEATAKMQRHFGGQRLYVPSALTLFHPLVEALGFDLAGALSYHYGGNQLLVPSDPVIDREERDKAMAADRAAGMEINQLVQKYRIGFRRVQAILKQAQTLRE
ncbi:MAG: hypothetical protein KME14_20440 [Tildeniella torsiva UHER 1998/13D]|jgi:Mor family transcriptional regulator|nr:hypothetical protein [Tildeniella torsiva UHER 1998/13D]